MARVSLSDIWIETRAFLQREGALVFPLGLATIGIAMLVTSLIVPEPVQNQMPGGPWMFGLVPVFILFLVGNLAISALVLLPGISVREAIRTAFSRIGTALIVLVGIALAATVAMIVVSIVAVAFGAGLGWSMQQSTVLAVMLALVPMIWASVRLLPVWPVIAQGKQGAAAAARTSFHMTRGLFWRLVTLTMLYVVLYMVFTSAVQFAGGAVFLLLGKLIGSPGLGRLLVAVAVSLVGAVIGSGWIVYVAILARRLALTQEPPR